MVAQFFNDLIIPRSFLLGNFKSGSKADNSRNIERPGAQTEFMSPAVLDPFQGRAFSDIKKSRRLLVRIFCAPRRSEDQLPDCPLCNQDSSRLARRLYETIIFSSRATFSFAINFPISLMGWIVPISLLAYIMETKSRIWS